MKYKIPLRYVKVICIASALGGIVGLAAGRWITGLCLLLGSYLLEKSRYRCPVCGKRLDMKYPLLRGAVCPVCGAELRERAAG